MEEQQEHISLSYLHRKVIRLEQMLVTMNEKIGAVLEKLLSHRTSQADGIRNMMQNDEDVCISLITELKSCITTSGGNGSRGKGSRSPNQEPPISRSPRIKPVPIANTQQQKQQTSASSAAQPRCRNTIRPSDNDNLNGQSLNLLGAEHYEYVPVPDPLDLNLDLDVYNVTAGSHAQSFAAVATTAVEDQDSGNDVIIIKAEDSEKFFSEMDSNNDTVLESNSRNWNSVAVAATGHPHPQSQRRNKKKFKSRCETPAIAAFWKSRFARKEYTLTNTFGNEVDARNQIKNEKDWRVNTTQVLTTRKKIYYQCYHSPHCPVTMYLSIPNGSETVTQFVSNGDHMNHTHQPKWSHKKRKT